MRVIIKDKFTDCSSWVAGYIAYRIKKAKPTAKKPFVLGLPTGSTPLGVYKELIKLYQNKKISFEHVVTFNMDEYVGLSPEDKNSYHHFMYENFFNYVNVNPKNIHILNGLTKDYAAECENYENAICYKDREYTTKTKYSFGNSLAFFSPASPAFFFISLMIGAIKVLSLHHLLQ